MEARIEEYIREETYRIYVTRSLQLAPAGKSITIKYDELLDPDKIKVDNRTGDEIAEDVMKKAGLSFGE